MQSWWPSILIERRSEGAKLWIVAKQSSVFWVIVNTGNV